MSYTPPSGAGIDFAVGGLDAGYVAPSGASIVFDFYPAPSSVWSGTVPFSVTADLAHGIAGDVRAPFISLTIAGEQPATGRVNVSVPFSSEVVGSQGPFGTLEAQVTILCAMGSVGFVEGVVSGEMPLTGESYASGACVGDAYATITLYAESSGGIAPVGVLSATLTISGTITSDAQAVGFVSGRLLISGSAYGSRGAASSAAGALPFIGSVSSAHGRVSDISAQMVLQGALHGVHGLSGEALGTVQFYPAITASTFDTTAIAAAVLRFSGSIYGYSPRPAPLPGMVVSTKQKRIEVYTE